VENIFRSTYPRFVHKRKDKKRELVKTLLAFLENKLVWKNKQEIKEELSRSYSQLANSISLNTKEK
jgi:hypothetical protein